MMRLMTEPDGELGPARTPRRTHHELGRTLGPRDVQKRLGDVGSCGLDVATAELGQEGAVLGQKLVRWPLSAVFVSDVDADQLGLRAGRDAGGAAHQVVASGRASEGDDDSLSRLPRPVDAVPDPVGGECLVDTIGEPEERELAERGEVALPEVVPERRVDPLRRVDVAVGHSATQGLGSRVDELDLVGAADPRVGNGLLLLDARDAFDHVVEALEVLDVHRRDHVDARLEELLDVLPSLDVPASGHIRVGELVHERDRRVPRQHRVEVHLLESRAAVLHLAPRDDLEIAELLGSPRTRVGLDEGDDHIGPPLGAPTTLVQHVEGLPDARGCAEVDAERSSGHAGILARAARHRATPLALRRR